MSIQTHKPTILCCNDSKGCYDRIVHGPASIAIQRAGIPIQPIQSMIGALRGFNHKIRTAYGDSEDSLNIDNRDQFHGMGQGNRSSPAMTTFWFNFSSSMNFSTSGSGSYSI